MSSQRNEGLEKNLLEQCESWSDQQIEDRIQDLLDFIHPVLLDGTSEYELRLDCVRITADKLARFVPVFEAEDNVFYPLLNGIIEFLAQVFDSVARTEDENRVMLLSVATALVDHTDALLLHGARYDGLGPGEIPSLPRLVPKILLSTFQYCGREQANTGSEAVKSSITRLFVRGRTLLENFSGLVEKMRIRTVLEDELDIVLELCSDLLAFHNTLFSIDLKSSLSVWKLYGKLAKEHFDRLRDKLDIQAALLVLTKEGLETFRKLETLLQERDQEQEMSKKVNRLVIALTFLVKMTVNLSEQYRNSVVEEFQAFSEFLRFMFLRGENIFPYLDPPVVEKMNRDLFLHNPARSLLLNVPAIDKFVEFLLSADPDERLAFSNVQIMMALVESDSVSEDLKVKLVDCLLEQFGWCEPELQRRDWLEGPEVPGLPVTLVGSYEWVLTRVCRFISTLGPDQFPDLEGVIFRNLVGQNNITCQLSSDLLCFVGRFGSAELCLAHLETISQLYLNLDQGTFSYQAPWLRVLVGRLFNFLGSGERKLWAERFSPVEAENLALWGAVNLGVLEDPETLKLLRDVCFAQFDRITEELNTTVLTNVLHTFTGLVKITKAEDYHDVMLSLWQRLAEGDFVPFAEYWLVQLFSALTRLTVALVPTLSRPDLRLLVSDLRRIVGSARGQGNPAFLVSCTLAVLHQVARLDWISQIENVDPCLVTELGSLSSSCLRTAVRSPLLRVPGLTYLRYLAERSNNPGFIRLCSDEIDVLPHFTRFLKEDDFGDRDTDDVEVKFDRSAPSLESFLGSEASDQIKRRVSSSNVLFPRKKRLRTDAEEEGDVKPAEILARLEKDLERLEKEILTSPLNMSEKDRLEVLQKRISGLIS